MDHFKNADFEPDIVTVSGDVDLATFFWLPRSFRTWFRERSGPPSQPVGLDLAQVTFLDCAGLRALLAIERHAERKGGGVTLTAMSPAVGRLLDLVELPTGSALRTVPPANGQVAEPNARVLTRAART
jgi:anti-anti-sigma factor